MTAWLNSENSKHAMRAWKTFQILGFAALIFYWPATSIFTNVYGDQDRLAHLWGWACLIFILASLALSVLSMIYDRMRRTKAEALEVKLRNDAKSGKELSDTKEAPVLHWDEDAVKLWIEYGGALESIGFNDQECREIAKKFRAASACLAIYLPALCHPRKPHTTS